MKKALIIVILATGFLYTSCGDDDSRSCTTCNQDQTMAFTVCREGNGNASVNGEDTGTDYDIYLNGLVQEGTTCGE